MAVNDRPEGKFHTGCAIEGVKNLLNDYAPWVAIHGDQVYESESVTPNPNEVFAVIVQTPVDNIGASGPNGRLWKKTYEVKVLSCRTYPYGQSSVYDFDDSYNAMREALLGEFEGMNVFKDGVKIGEISEIADLGDVDLTAQRGNFEVRHHGLKLRVVAHPLRG